MLQRCELCPGATPLEHHLSTIFTEQAETDPEKLLNIYSGFTLTGTL